MYERYLIPASRLSQKQKVHFFLWTVLPLFCSPFVFLLTLSESLPWLPSVLIFCGMWGLTGGLGISVGYHRYFTHKSFEAPVWLESVMALAGSMAAQGPLFYWVAIHRCHHEHSDQNGDPHSPKPSESDWLNRVLSFWHGHMGWVITHDVPNPAFYAKDLRRKPHLDFFNRTYALWSVLGLILPGLILLPFHPNMTGFWQGVLWGGLMRILIGNQIIWSINSVCHCFGSRSYEVSDGSTNFPMLAIFSFGESWHNNHHAFPYAATFSQKWWQIDLGYYAICLFELMGFANKVKRPNRLA